MAIVWGVEALRELDNNNNKDIRICRTIGPRDIGVRSDMNRLENIAGLVEGQSFAPSLLNGARPQDERR